MLIHTALRKSTCQEKKPPFMLIFRGVCVCVYNMYSFIACLSITNVLFRFFLYSVLYSILFWYIYFFVHFLFVFFSASIWGAIFRFSFFLDFSVQGSALFIGSHSLVEHMQFTPYKRQTGGILQDTNRRVPHNYFSLFDDLLKFRILYTVYLTACKSNIRENSEKITIKLPNSDLWKIRFSLENV